VKAGDPMTISVAILVMVATAVVATWIPARRATRVDPIVALRYD
jgi:putative ABC transport system permease protein